MGPRLKVLGSLFIKFFTRLSESDGSIRYNRACERPFTHGRFFKKRFQKMRIFLFSVVLTTLVLRVVHCDRAIARTTENMVVWEQISFILGLGRDHFSPINFLWFVLTTCCFRVYTVTHNNDHCVKLKENDITQDLLQIRLFLVLLM
jgi:hypothetical protein